MSYGMAITTLPERLPKWEDWNAAIKQNGFDLVLDSIDWSNQTGFLPAMLMGHKTGFELYCETVNPPRSLFGLVKSKQPAQSVVSARLGSYQLELTAANAALANLQMMTDGVYSDDGGSKIDAQQLLSAARSQYYEMRFLLHRIGAASRLGADQPPLDANESQEGREQLIARLVQRRVIVLEGADTPALYRLHKHFARDLEAELKAIA